MLTGDSAEAADTAGDVRGAGAGAAGVGGLAGGVSVSGMVIAPAAAGGTTASSGARAADVADGFDLTDPAPTPDLRFARVTRVTIIDDRQHASVGLLRIRDYLARGRRAERPGALDRAEAARAGVAVARLDADDVVAAAATVEPFQWALLKRDDSRMAVRARGFATRREALADIERVCHRGSQLRPVKVRLEDGARVGWWFVLDGRITLVSGMTWTAKMEPQASALAHAVLRELRAGETAAARGVARGIDRAGDGAGTGGSSAEDGAEAAATVRLARGNAA